MSNRRRVKSAAARRPLPRCRDCNGRTTRRRVGGSTVVDVRHAPGCPAWRGITPDAAEQYADAEAATGRPVTFARLQLPEGWPS